ncbi:MAG: hypothetical protein V3W44_00895 [Dehalococcoidales bacterium]
MTDLASLTAGTPCRPITFISNREQRLNSLGFGHSIAEMFHAISVNHFQGLVNVFSDNNGKIQVAPTYLR